MLRSTLIWLISVPCVKRPSKPEMLFRIITGGCMAKMFHTVPKLSCSYTYNHMVPSLGRKTLTINLSDTITFISRPESNLGGLDCEASIVWSPREAVVRSVWKNFWRYVQDEEACRDSFGYEVAMQPVWQGVWYKECPIHTLCQSSWRSSSVILVHEMISWW